MSDRRIVVQGPATWRAMAVLIVATASAVVAACAQPVPFRPEVSIQELMQSVVDPAADALWESVSSVTTASGTEEHQPRTDEDWATLRQHAVRLAESANLLVIRGRPVAHPGSTLDDAHLPGLLDAAQIARALDADRPRFERFAHGLHGAASEALKAIDARDVPRLSVAGAAIDRACESCHLVFWYPNSRRPPAVAVSGDTQRAAP